MRATSGAESVLRCRSPCSAPSATAARWSGALAAKAPIASSLIRCVCEELSQQRNGGWKLQALEMSRRREQTLCVAFLHLRLHSSSEAFHLNSNLAFRNRFSAC